MRELPDELDASDWGPEEFEAAAPDTLHVDRESCETEAGTHSSKDHDGDTDGI